MKYLSLENSEFRELVNIRKGSLLLYFVFFGLLLGVAYFIAGYVLPKNSKINTVAIIFVLSFTYLIIFIYSNRKYFLDLIKRDKKVYRGVLSSKTLKSRTGKYHFNVDGNIFVIDENTFNKYQVGEILEIHTSVRTKHLFKIEQVNEVA